MLQKKGIIPTCRWDSDKVIELFDGLYITIAGDSNSVFCAFQLVLEVPEVLICFEVGVSL